MRKATIYAQDEPQGTVYILTRPTGQLLMADWPQPLLELEPDAVWTTSNTGDGVGSNYAFSCQDPYYEEVTSRDAARTRSNAGQERFHITKVSGLSVEVQPRQRDELVQDLWPAGRDQTSGHQDDPALGDGTWLDEAETGDNKP